MRINVAGQGRRRPASKPHQVFDPIISVIAQCIMTRATLPATVRRAVAC